LDRCSDPFVAAMLSSMVRHNASARREDDEEPDRELSRARMIIRRLKTEISTTRAILQRAAQIAGACPSCLGLNAVCPHCRGRGHPGSRGPEHEEFLSWIAPPALERLNLEGTEEVRHNRVNSEKTERRRYER
jgi:hypothetical protein